jgi:hypothetical protein
VATGQWQNAKKETLQLWNCRTDKGKNMKNLFTTSCAALLVVASAAPSFAETRTAPGEWRPDNAAALEQ